MEFLLDVPLLPYIVEILLLWICKMNPLHLMPQQIIDEVVVGVDQLRALVLILGGGKVGQPVSSP